MRYIDSVTLPCTRVTESDCGKPEDETVPAQIIVNSIPVIFPVSLIVFVVIRNKVIKCKSVMARYEINTKDIESIIFYRTFVTLPMNFKARIENMSL